MIKIPLWRNYLFAGIMVFLFWNGAPDHETQWKTLNVKASELYQAGEIQEAVAAAEEAVAFAEKNFSADHPNLAKSLNNLGILYLLQKEPVKAEFCLKKALEIIQTRQDPDGLKADILLNLAKLEFSNEQYSRALSSAEQALENLEKIYGAQAEEIVPSLLFLTQLNQAMGLSGEAEQYAQRLKKIGNL